ncbi:sigma-70 family RNA polymerase sigma factor [Pyxidicoccus parkwayensis]|uniref:Sigma-70 family RNA polymerase sigma factor n=1 Tax=Pyxidicoccus parkwayensis TaxID=2813578 RepID=A0ABX7NT76_9BACT|nr:sigma-70 family RNA polymerase sigma factor [Pyxidicoccus parkwaysis]QSQ19343.1 sigma-70 family RNA polymerase sigma factor [Pyxidicoccus parkwaysis]
MRSLQRPLTAAEQQLVPQAHRLVWWAVHRFVRRNPAARGFEDDLASYGWLGALYAAQHWRPDGGASFKTYASRPVRRDVARGWLILTGVASAEDGRPVPRQEVPLDDALNVAVPPTQERMVEAHRLRASIGEWLCAHMRPDTKPHTRERAVRAYLMHLDGETLENIGQQFGCTRENVRQILVKADEAVLRWRAALNPAWERSAS